MEEALLQYMYADGSRLLWAQPQRKKGTHTRIGGQLQADRLLQPQMLTDR